MARTLKDYPSVALELRDFDGKIDFTKVFGRNAPLHIEIGSGKATFLVNQAKLLPRLNFLGIERARKYYRYAVDRIGRWSLTNVRLIRTDAAQFITNRIPDSSVECFHIYFPDPWPKKRHHKRRLLNPSNLEQLLRCLTPKGTITIATDHNDYFEYIEKLLTAQNNTLKKIKFLPTAASETGEWVGTNFERKYLKENKPIFTIAVKKI